MFTRSGAALSLTVAGALVVSGCGGNTNTSSSGCGANSAPVQCGGKEELHASGATAQENAMEQYGSIPLPSPFQSKLETAVNAIS